MHFEIFDESNGKRLDVFLLEIMDEEGYSRTAIKKYIESGSVIIDSLPIVKPAFILKTGMKGEIIIPEKPIIHSSLPIAENIPFEILFENEDMLVLNKPSGMPTHPDEHYHSGTVVNAVLGYLKTSHLGGDLHRPGIVHRLDKDTSGCLIIAKNEKMHRYLSEKIAQREVTKKYTALVFGALPVEKGTIDSPLARDPHNRERMTTMDTHTAKHAITHFDVLERYAHPALTLVSVHIITGRTHQIRAHFRSIGFPVVGDALYANEGINESMKELFGLNRMFLHASFISLVLPSGEKIEITSSLPIELETVLEKARNKEKT